MGGVVVVPRLRNNDDPAHQSLIRARRTPSLRLREVVYHHIDLGTGYSFDHVSTAWVVREIGESARRFADGPAGVGGAGDGRGRRGGPGGPGPGPRGGG